MIVGDIAGKGTIYDDSGKAIVHDDESVLDSFKAKSKSWVAEYQEKIIEVNLPVAQKILFDGEFTVTNKRILFLAEPRHFGKNFNNFGTWGNSAEGFQHVINRSNITKEKNGKLYLQIGWEELKKIRLGPRNSFVYLKLNDSRLVRFVFDKESGRRLKHIVSKMIELR